MELLSSSDGDIEICGEPWEPLHTNNQARCVFYPYVYIFNYWYSYIRSSYTVSIIVLHAPAWLSTE